MQCKVFKGFMVCLRIFGLARISARFMEICMAHVEFRTINPNTLNMAAMGVIVRVIPPVGTVWMTVSHALDV